MLKLLLVPLMAIFGLRCTIVEYLGEREGGGGGGGEFV